MDVDQTDTHRLQVSLPLELLGCVIGLGAS